MDIDSRPSRPGLSQATQRPSPPAETFAIWFLDFCQTDFDKTRGEERKKWCAEAAHFCGEPKLKKDDRLTEKTWRSVRGLLRKICSWREVGGPIRTRLALRREGNIVRAYTQYDWEWAWCRIDDQAIIALGEVAGRLAICANSACERFFIRRRRQAYCSRKCRHTVNKRAYRKRKAKPA
jgi:hypothetical protein